MTRLSARSVSMMWDDKFLILAAVYLYMGLVGPDTKKGSNTSLLSYLRALTTQHRIFAIDASRCKRHTQLRILILLTYR